MVIVKLGRPGSGKTAGALMSACERAPAVAWGRIPERVEIGDEYCDWPHFRTWAQWHAVPPLVAALDVEARVFAEYMWRVAETRYFGSVVIDELHAFSADPRAADIVEKAVREHRHTDADFYLVTQTLVRLPSGLRTVIQACGDELHVHRTTAPLDVRELNREWSEVERLGTWPAWAHDDTGAPKLLGHIAKDERMCHARIVVDIARGEARFEAGTGCPHPTPAR